MFGIRFGVLMVAVVTLARPCNRPERYPLVHRASLCHVSGAHGQEAGTDAV